MTEQEKLELAYLRFFYDKCDMGPADDDVRCMIIDDYKRKGNTMPAGYDWRDEDEDQT